MAKLTEFIKKVMKDFQEYGKGKSPEEWMEGLLIRLFDHTPEEAQNISKEILEGIESYHSKDKDAHWTYKSELEDSEISSENAQKILDKVESASRLMVKGVESTKNKNTATK